MYLYLADNSDSNELLNLNKFFSKYILVEIYINSCDYLVGEYILILILIHVLDFDFVLIVWPFPLLQNCHRYAESIGWSYYNDCAYVIFVFCCFALFSNMSLFQIIDPQPQLRANSTFLMVHVMMVGWKIIFSELHSLRNACFI